MFFCGTALLAQTTGTTSKHQRAMSPEKVNSIPTHCQRSHHQNVQLSLKVCLLVSAHLLEVTPLEYATITQGLPLSVLTCQRSHHQNGQLSLKVCLLVSAHMLEVTPLECATITQGLPLSVCSLARGHTIRMGNYHSRFASQ